MNQTTQLHEKRCEPCEGIGEALNHEQINTLRPQLASEWRVSDDNTTIQRNFSFQNFHDTMAFVNAIAWIAHQENHHPDIELGYNYCRVHFTTHALGGLSHNDFICAAKIDAL